MIVEQLSLEEMSALQGATHKIVLTWRDLSAADLSQVLTLAPMAAEMAARGVRGLLKTPFAAPGLTSLKLSIGDGVADDQMLDEMELAEAATEHGSFPGTEGASWTTGYTAADNLLATFDATGANVNTLTAGEVWVYLEIRDGRNG